MKRLAVGSEPNPSVVRAIWERVMEWAVESGRLTVDGGQSTVDGGQSTVDGGKVAKAARCPRCGRELHIHARGRIGGCENCLETFHLAELQ